MKYNSEYNRRDKEKERYSNESPRELNSINRYKRRERDSGREYDYRPSKDYRDKDRDMERDYKYSNRDRDYNRNRDYSRDKDYIRDKDYDYRDRDREREINNYNRDRREDDYYNRKYKDKYRKSRSRSRTRSKERSRSSRRERKYYRRSSSNSSNNSNRNEIIDQTIKDGLRQIEEAESFDRTILMYSFPTEVNEKKIFNFFASNDILPIIDIKLLRDSRTGRSKNCCYVEFDTKDRARQAINLSGQLLCGQPCQIVSSQAEKNRQALAHKSKKEKDNENNPGLMNNIVKYSKSNEQIDINDAPMKIYVGGLTENLSNITEDDLCNIFGFGEIDSIELHKDPITGRSKGYAFIQFHRGSKAKEAIQAMNGFVYQGKALKVGEANENNTVIKGKMFLAKQQQQQQLAQQQLQEQMLLMNQQEGQDNMNLNNDEKDLEDNAEQINNDN
jgi:RNA-binding protein 39